MCPKRLGSIALISPYRNYRSLLIHAVMPSASEQPSQREHYQEQQILRMLQSLGFTAKALPKVKPGNSGVKAKVRAKMTEFPAGVFDKAWERLRSQGNIR